MFSFFQRRAEGKAVTDALEAADERAAEIIRRKELCVERATWVCEDQAVYVMRYAKQFYKEIYGEDWPE